MNTQEMSETPSLQPAGIQTEGKYVQSFGNERLLLQRKLRSLRQKRLSLKQNVQSQKVLLKKMKLKQSILQQHVSALTKKVYDMQSQSYDGTYIWKITNVQARTEDAICERQTSVFSPSFYSSPTGYKMRTHLYLDGDGHARGTHMSLLFELMKGEYDEILKWPFTYRVTFCLCDQSGGDLHIIDSFRPDIKLNNSEHSGCEMNIFSGIAKFCPLSVLQQDGNCYIRDDTIFIKTSVDFNETPALMLPYAFSLNSGLPSHTQQLLIQRERVNFNRMGIVDRITTNRNNHEVAQQALIQQIQAFDPGSTNESSVNGQNDCSEAEN